MPFEPAYSAQHSAHNMPWTNRTSNAIAMQLPRSQHADSTFSARITKRVFEFLDAAFIAERSQRSSRNSRLALQPLR